MAHEKYPNTLSSIHNGKEEYLLSFESVEQIYGDGYIPVANILLFRNSHQWILWNSILQLFVSENPELHCSESNEVHDHKYNISTITCC